MLDPFTRNFRSFFSYMDWQDFATAFALMMIFEGISPFIMPARVRKLAELVGQTDDKTLRGIALVSMFSGLLLLYLVRGS